MCAKKIKGNKNQISLFSFVSVSNEDKNIDNKKLIDEDQKRNIENKNTKENHNDPERTILQSSTNEIAQRDIKANQEGQQNNNSISTGGNSSNYKRLVELASASNNFIFSTMPGRSNPSLQQNTTTTKESSKNIIGSGKESLPGNRLAENNQTTPMLLEDNRILEGKRNNTHSRPDRVFNEVNFIENNSYSSNIFEEESAESFDTLEICQRSLKAVKLLKLLQKESRLATLKEKQILEKYIGFGNIVDFEKNHPEELRELKNILSEDEFIKVINSSTNILHKSNLNLSQVLEFIKVTPIAKLDKVKILNPCCGSGELITALFKDLKEKAVIHGIEKDYISSEIAKYLHEGKNIRIFNEPFENIDTRYNKYDLIISAFPYGVNKISDNYSSIADQQPLINFYMGKSIDALSDRGVLVALIPREFYDTNNKDFILSINKNSDCKSRILLPKGIDRITTLTTNYDIVIYQKNESKKIFDLNPYFKHEIGIPIIKGTNTLSLGVMTPNDIKDILATELYYAMVNSHKKSETNFLNNNTSILDKWGSSGGTIDKKMEIDSSLYIGELFEKDKNIFIRTPNVNFDKTATQLKFSNMQTDKILMYLKTKENLKTLMSMENNLNISEEDLEKQRKELRSSYYNFTEKYGKFTDKSNNHILSLDVKSYFVKHLEKPNKQLGVIEADILHKRVFNSSTKTIETLEEAVYSSIAEKGKIDIAYISQIPNLGFEGCEETTLKQLLATSLLIKNPFSQEYELYETFVSGNVRRKLAQLETIRYILKENKYNKYAKILKKALPKRIPIQDIEFSLTTPFIQEEIKVNILNQILKCNAIDRLSYCQETATYKLILTKKVPLTSITHYEYGTSRMHALEIINKILGCKELKVEDKETFFALSGKMLTRNKLNIEETELVLNKANLIQKTFTKHILEHLDYSSAIEEKYNKLFNSNKATVYSHANLLEFKNINPLIKLRPHQKRAVIKGILEHSFLLDHVVGSGKTYTLAVTIMERKRLGLDKKPLLIVPKSILGQWERDFLTIYPNANLLVCTEQNFSVEKRNDFISNASLNNWDCIIMSHSSFSSLELSTKYMTSYIEKHIASVNKIIDFNITHKRKHIINENEKLKKAFEKKLVEIKNLPKQDKYFFDDMKIDSLYVDEAHEFKNLPFATKNVYMSGINPTGSNKSYDLYWKSQIVKNNKYILTNKKDAGLFFATGTPISNSLAELYIFSKFLNESELEKRRISHFDAWSATFAKIESKYQVDSLGKGFAYKQMFSNFVNIPELSSIYTMFADVITNEDIKNYVKLPEIEGGKATNIIVKPTKEQIEFMNTLVKRADLIKKNQISPLKDNMLKVTGEAKRSAIDMRLINKNYSPSNKIVTATEIIFNTYKKWQCDKGVQLVFSDVGVPSSSKENFNLYQELKTLLTLKGIPSHEIAFIHSYENENEKSKLFELVNNGDIRVLLGSTQKLGTGVNVQNRLVALHHLDAPWRPTDLQQREGRIIRQGNMFLEERKDFKINIFRYATENTFDCRAWQILENKSNFITKFKAGTVRARTGEDISYEDEVKNIEEMKAISSGNPYFTFCFKLKNEYVKEQTIINREQINIKTMKKEILDFEDNNHKKYNVYEKKTETLCLGLKPTFKPKFAYCIASEYMKAGFILYEENTGLFLYYDKNPLSEEEREKIKSTFHIKLVKELDKIKEKKTKIEDNINNMRTLVNKPIDESYLKSLKTILTLSEIELNNYEKNRNNKEHQPYIPFLSGYEREIEDIINCWKTNGHNVAKQEQQKLACKS